mmetsp:Transcript_46149/g.128399  ORF Transcript_46149/g.128399 Transcript_46149/m.128399 type:complete len:92 (+) Transcript_46149:904-1179(+)
MEGGNTSTKKDAGERAPSRQMADFVLSPSAVSTPNGEFCGFLLQDGVRLGHPDLSCLTVGRATPCDWGRVALVGSLSVGAFTWRLDPPKYS